MSQHLALVKDSVVTYERRVLEIIKDTKIMADREYGACCGVP